MIKTDVDENKNYTVTVAVIVNEDASIISKNVPGACLNKLDDMLDEILDYINSRNRREENE